MGPAIPHCKKKHKIKVWKRNVFHTFLRALRWTKVWKTVLFHTFVFVFFFPREWGGVRGEHGSYFLKTKINNFVRGG